MPNVNIADRAALERAYPPEAFAEDTARNADPTTGRLHGVRILSAPDAAGELAFERGSREVGEAASAAFVAAYRRDPVATPGAASSDPDGGYRGFLEEIIDAARRFGYRADESPGKGDPRIRGLRQ
ncbi:MAG: hypothetical protein WA184_18400 [Stellaceae bacterium]